MSPELGRLSTIECSRSTRRRRSARRYSTVPILSNVSPHGHRDTEPIDAGSIERSLDRSLSVDFVHRCDKDIGGFTDARDTLDTRDTLDWRSVSGQLAQDDAKTQDHP